MGWTRCKNVNVRTWSSFETPWSQKVPAQAVMGLKWLEIHNALEQVTRGTLRTYTMRYAGRRQHQMRFQPGQPVLNTLCRIWPFNFWLLSVLQSFSLDYSQGYKFALLPLAWQILWVSQNKGYDKCMADKTSCYISACKFPGSSRCRWCYVNLGHFTGTGVVTVWAKCKVILTASLRILCQLIWKYFFLVDDNPCPPLCFKFQSL